MRRGTPPSPAVQIPDRLTRMRGQGSADVARPATAGEMGVPPPPPPPPPRPRAPPPPPPRVPTPRPQHVVADRLGLTHFHCHRPPSGAPRCVRVVSAAAPPLLPGILTMSTFTGKEGYYIGGVFFLLAGIVALYFVCIRGRIKFAGAVLSVACKVPSSSSLVSPRRPLRHSFRGRARCASLGSSPRTADV